MSVSFEDELADLELCKVASHSFWLRRSARYPTTFEVIALGDSPTKLDVDGGGCFLIDKQCLPDVIVTPDTVVDKLFISLSFKSERSRDMKMGAVAFLEFFDKWKKNTLILTREFSTDHFSWDEFRKGLLVSEGMADNPTFTMGNTEKTRWLPTAYYPDYPNGIGGIALRSLTEADKVFLDSVRTWVPFGVFVSIAVGRSKPIRLAWLNEGETVIRGPLSAAQFSADRMILVKNTRIGSKDDIDFRIIDLTGVDLSGLKQRPYKGTQIETTAWWNDAGTRAFMLGIAAKLV